ncbi:MAG: DUF1667 domain-containing protein [Clostridiales bacterium]|nr:DUF1667 domain-containing protein [Clostridiales bacterium]
MKKRTLTCISCPLGCQVTAEINKGEIVSVTGNTCKRGDVYARKELTNPTRIVTSTVEVIGGESSRLPVKTRTDIPKSMIFDCILALKGLKVKAPLKVGDVVLENVCGTGVDIIATKTIKTF